MNHAKHSLPEPGLTRRAAVVISLLAVLLASAAIAQIPADQKKVYRWTDANDDREVPDTMSAIYEYGDKFHLNYSCYFGNDNFGYGEQFCGNEGTVEVLNRSMLRFTPQKFNGQAVGNRKEAVVELLGNDNLAVEAHIRNLVEAIQGKAQLVAPVEIGQQAAVSGHMATLALRNKKMVRWDAKSRKTIIG